MKQKVDPATIAAAVFVSGRRPPHRCAAAVLIQQANRRGDSAPQGLIDSGPLRNWQTTPQWIDPASHLRAFLEAGFWGNGPGAVRARAFKIVCWAAAMRCRSARPL